MDELEQIRERYDWHVTLAPPLSRAVAKIHPDIYHLLTILPFLRTHILCWIEKG